MNDGRERWEQEWGDLRQAVGRTQAAAETAQHESAAWATLSDLIRTAVMPHLTAWRSQMAALCRPLPLVALRAGRQWLLVAYRFPGWRLPVVLARLQIAGLYALLAWTWLWQRRRIILRTIALAVALVVALAVLIWLVRNVGAFIDALLRAVP